MKKVFTLAMLFFLTAQANRKPLVAFYGVKGNLIACPEDITPPELAKLYKFATVVFTEPMATIKSN